MRLVAMVLARLQSSKALIEVGSLVNLALSEKNRSLIDFSGYHFARQATNLVSMPQQMTADDVAKLDIDDEADDW